MIKKELMNETIIKIAEKIDYNYDVDIFIEVERYQEAIYISVAGQQVRRGVKNSFTTTIGTINGIEVIIDKGTIDNLKEYISLKLRELNELFDKNNKLKEFPYIDFVSKIETQKEKKMKIVKAIKITFNDGNKVEWKNIRKYTDDKGKLFVAIDDTKEIQGSSKLELQVWYDFKDIKTYTITNKVVEVKGEE